MKLIYIEWTDAISSTQTWRTKGEILDWAKDVDYLVKQIGWVIEENDKYLILSSQMNTEGFLEPQFAHTIMIPTTWIRKRKTIKL